MRGIEVVFVQCEVHLNGVNVGLIKLCVVTVFCLWLCKKERTLLKILFAGIFVHVLVCFLKLLHLKLYLHIRIKQRLRHGAHRVFVFRVFRPMSSLSYFYEILLKAFR
jgi:hypothetical protein